MDLMDKYKYISEMKCINSKIYVRIEFMFNDIDAYTELKFDSVKECGDFLFKNYESLKDEYVKDKFRRYQNKISNQSNEINNLLKRSK